MVNAANEMGVFERVIERGSFAAAAQDVGLSPSAVSKLIMRLEQRLGVRLINRTTRRLALTAEGKTYLKRSREILAAIEAAEIGDRFRAHVTARPPACARAASHDRRSFWSGAIGVFGSLSPDNDRFPGDKSRGRSRRRECGHCDADGKLPDSSLVACKIVDLTQIICASPEYLARHGRPLVPSDLARHRCLILNGIPEPTTWTFHGDNGRVAVEVRGAVSADSSDVLLRLAMEGVGIVRLGELAVARALSNGSLEPLLLDVQVSEGYPLWALLPPGRQRSPKVKVFLEFLNERLGLAPWRTTGRG